MYYFGCMRKWVLLLLTCLLLLPGIVYLSIPSPITIEEVSRIALNAKAFTRSFYDETTWKQWWPEEQVKNGNRNNFVLHSNKYSLVEKRHLSLLLFIQSGTDSISSELFIVPVQPDSVEITWSGVVNTSANPLKRIKVQQWAKSISADMRLLLQKIRDHYSHDDHLYGVTVREEKVVDSNLISTSLTTNRYPMTTVVYSMLDKLKAFAQKNGAKQSGLPMLNITAGRDSTYLVKVALPVDKKLRDEGSIQYRWMLGGGNILVTEVKGGPSQIEKAFAAMELYVDEHDRIAPAIPFQSLVTDRRAEPDTNKWITKIHWPVM